MVTILFLFKSRVAKFEANQNSKITVPFEPKERSNVLSLLKRSKAMSGFLNDPKLPVTNIRPSDWIARSLISHISSSFVI